MDDDGFPWDESRLVAPPTLHHICIGERPTLYCETTKQLFGLNPSADLIWRSLIEGKSPSEVQRALAGRGLADAEARAFVRDAILSWTNRGLLTPGEVLDQLLRSDCVTRYVRIHELTARISFVDSPTDAFDAVFGQFRHSICIPNLSISVVKRARQFFTFKRDVPLGACSAEQLMPRLVALVKEEFTSAAQNSFLAHAAFVVRRNQGVLLCGAPGAGKTTLCAALLGRGYEYCSDDVVRVERDGKASGIPFAPAVKESAWPVLAPYAPEITSLPTYRRSDGQYVRYLPVRSSGVAPREINFVLLLARQPRVVTALQAIEPLEAVCAILESAFSTTGGIEHDALKYFAGAIEAAACYRFAYSELEEAVRSVEVLTHE